MLSKLLESKGTFPRLTKVVVTTCNLQVNMRDISHIDGVNLIKIF